MAVAVRDVESSAATVPPGGPSPTGPAGPPTAAPPPPAGDPDHRARRQTRLGAMSSYHLGWTADRAAADSGSGNSCAAPWRSGRPTIRGQGRATPCPWPTRSNGSTTSPWSTMTSRMATYERRHRPAVWVVWGAPRRSTQATACTPSLSRALSGATARGSPARRRSASTRHPRGHRGSVSRPCARGTRSTHRRPPTCAGSWQDRRPDRGGAGGGPLMGGAGPRRRRSSAAPARMGVAFQVRDDWLGTWGDRDVTGKGCGDISRRKITYPVVAPTRDSAAPPSASSAPLPPAPAATRTPSSRCSTRPAPATPSRRAAPAQPLGAATRRDLWAVVRAADDFQSIVEFVVERAA